MVADEGDVPRFDIGSSPPGQTIVVGDSPITQMSTKARRVKVSCLARGSRQTVTAGACAQVSFFGTQLLVPLSQCGDTFGSLIDQAPGSSAVLCLTIVTPAGRRPGSSPPEA